MSRIGQLAANLQYGLLSQNCFFFYCFFSPPPFFFFTDLPCRASRHNDFCSFSSNLIQLPPSPPPCFFSLFFLSLLSNRLAIGTFL